MAGRTIETYLSLADVYEKGKNFTEMEKALGEAEKLAESKQEKESIYFHARRDVRKDEEVQRVGGGIPQSDRP